MNVDWDEALRAYMKAPVRPGMEERILARCRRASWLRWPVLGLAVAACLATAIWLRPVEQPRRVLTARQYSVPEHAEQKPGVPKSTLLHPSRRSPDAIHALWRFAQEHPDVALQLTEFHEPEPVVPLSIEPLAIDVLGDPK